MRFNGNCVVVLFPGRAHGGAGVWVVGNQFWFVESVVDNIGLKVKRNLSAKDDVRGISMNLASKDSVEVTLKEYGEEQGSLE